MKNQRAFILIFILAMVFEAKAQNVNCFYSPSNSSYPLALVKTMATADFNNDGHLDLAVGGGNQIRIFSGNSTGSFTSTYTLMLMEVVKNIKAIKVDGDNYPDLLITQGDLGSSSSFTGFGIYLNNGVGGFITPSSLHYICASPGVVLPAKVNNDPHLDFIVTKSCSPTFIAFEGDGLGGASNPFTVTGPLGQGLCADGIVGDFDNDGYQDVATTRTMFNSVIVFNGNASGTFTTITSYTTGPYNTGAVPGNLRSADLDNDGYLDLVVLHSNSASYAVLKGGAAGFTYIATSASLSAIPRALALEDFDQDGKKDMVVSSNANASTNLVIYKGNGNGTFTPDLQLPSGIRPSDILTDDINGDGRKDIIAANEGSNMVKVWLNDLPALSASSSQSVICQGGTATLTASGANTYTWSNGSNMALTMVSPSVTTTYLVTGMTSNGCSASTSLVQNVSICTGLDVTIEGQNQVRLYPNPASSEIYLEKENDRDGELTVMDITGQVIYTALVKGSKAKISVMSWPAGIYTVLLREESGEITRYKITKN